MSTSFRPEQVVLRPGPFLKSLHVSPRRRAIYVNNPKVACSTIKLALQRAELDNPGYQPLRSVHDHAASPLLTFPDLDLDRLGALFDDYYVFSFVRCPYRRLQSAYANKILVPQKQGRPREQAGFAARETPSFSAFVHAIAGQNPRHHNPHWRPQWINLSKEAIRFDFIGRLEAFGADWIVLSERLGLCLKPERAGKSTDPSQAIYTAETAALVAQVYARDFELFGYDPGAVPGLAL